MQEWIYKKLKDLSKNVNNYFLFSQSSILNRNDSAYSLRLKETLPNI